MALIFFQEQIFSSDIEGDTLHGQHVSAKTRICENFSTNFFTTATYLQKFRPAKYKRYRVYIREIVEFPIPDNSGSFWLSRGPGFLRRGCGFLLRRHSFLLRGCCLLVCGCGLTVGGRGLTLGGCGLTLGGCGLALGGLGLTLGGCGLGGLGRDW